MSTSDLKRRLDRLTHDQDQELCIVEQFVGMTEHEALRHRFGDKGAPAGVKIVIIENSPGPSGVPYSCYGHPEDPKHFDYSARFQMRKKS